MNAFLSFRDSIHLLRKEKQIFALTRRLPFVVWRYLYTVFFDKIFTEYQYDTAIPFGEYEKMETVIQVLPGEYNLQSGVAHGAARGRHALNIKKNMDSQCCSYFHASNIPRSLMLLYIVARRWPATPLVLLAAC